METKDNCRETQEMPKIYKTVLISGIQQLWHPVVILFWKFRLNVKCVKNCGNWLWPTKTVNSLFLIKLSQASPVWRSVDYKYWCLQYIGMTSYLKEVSEKNESQLLSWELVAFRDQEKNPAQNICIYFSSPFPWYILFYFLMQIKLDSLAQWLEICITLCFWIFILCLGFLV